MPDPNSRTASAAASASRNDSATAWVVRASSRRRLNVGKSARIKLEIATATPIVTTISSKVNPARDVRIISSLYHQIKVPLDKGAAPKMRNKRANRKKRPEWNWYFKRCNAETPPPNQAPRHNPPNPKNRTDPKRQKESGKGSGPAKKN